MSKKQEQEPLPEIDESLLTQEQKEEFHRKPNYVPFLIFFGVLLVLIAVCLIVIFALPAGQ